MSFDQAPKGNAASQRAAEYVVPLGVGGQMTVGRGLAIPAKGKGLEP